MSNRKMVKKHNYFCNFCYSLFDRRSTCWISSMIFNVRYENIIKTSLNHVQYLHPLIYLKLLYVQEHVLNEANKSLKQRVCNIPNSFDSK